MAEKADYDHAEQLKGDDVATHGAVELTPGEDRRLLRKIDMW